MGRSLVCFINIHVEYIKTKKGIHVDVFYFCYEKVIHDKKLIFHRVFDKLNSAVIMMIYIYMSFIMK